MRWAVRRLRGPLRSDWALGQEALRAFCGKAHVLGLSLTFYPRKGQRLKEANSPGAPLFLRLGTGSVLAPSLPASSPSFSCHIPPLLRGPNFSLEGRSPSPPVHNSASCFPLIAPGQLLPSPLVLLVYASCFSDLWGESPWKPTLTPEISLQWPLINTPISISPPRWY